MPEFTKSHEMFAKSSRYLAGGVSSTLRSAMKPVPLFVDTAKGTSITDVDGNTYIDYLMAYGPLILGHAHAELGEAAAEAIANGTAYGLQYRLEIELARKLVEVLPCADQVAFSGSGTEAVMLALRLARAYTEKTKVLRFEGHYHGWSDSIFTSFPTPDMKASAAGQSLAGTGGQSENSLQDIILIPWNDEAVLEKTLREHAQEIACVITEPVMCNSGCLQPREGYLEKLRSLTKELGIVLIFDEVITGFRLGLSGAHGRFGIQPDLVTIGKAVAAGYPLSVVAGSEAVMSLIANAKVNHLGTLNGNPLALATGLKTLEILSRNNGEAFTRMESLMIRLAEGLRERLGKFGIPGVVNQIGPVMNMMFIDRPNVRDFSVFQERDAAKYARFAENMLDQGVLVRPNGLWYISTQHTEADIEETVEVVENVLARMSS